MYRKFIKPFFDLLASLVALCLLAPIFGIIVLVLYVVNHGKPFFVQQRPGLKGKIFTIYKFKTMNDKRGADGELLPDVERMTAMGRFIRKTSLDEIPQLLNVVRGDMSLIGPRPLLVSYLPLYNKEQARRHDVRPGITGWAQVNGRNAISWEEKFRYDVWYVDNLSFITDLKILFKTVYKVFRSEGISASETVTMEMFRGTAQDT